MEGLINEVEEFGRQITNLKSKIRRRVKRLAKTSDPLERQRIEFDIQMLKKKVFALELEEFKSSIKIIEVVADLDKQKPSIREVDWKKAGKA